MTASHNASLRAFILGISAAAFFAVTFVLNRSMATAGGHWAWSSSLRFLIMVPLLALTITIRGLWPELLSALRAAPTAWIAWGMVGFVLFYAPITFAADLVPAWVIAGSWPITIVLGLLLAPIIYNDHRRSVPGRALAGSLIIVVGVLLLQVQQARTAEWGTVVLGAGLVLVSAAAYPLGNRKMMLALERRGLGVDPMVRLTAMTLGSLPAWIMIAAYAHTAAGLPPSEQVAQAGIIAISSGIIATMLFFAATDLAQHDPTNLAAVEATQAAEVPFALGLEILILDSAWPDPIGFAGLAIIILGIAAYSRVMGRQASLHNPSTSHSHKSQYHERAR